jgi:probable rRNA maturation factor
MFKPEINISIKRNLSLPVDKNWLENIAKTTLKAEGISPTAEMGLLITDSKTIHKLNRIYRDMDKPTDVLAFKMTSDKKRGPGTEFISAPDGIIHLGEVVISYPQAVRQAQEQGHDVTHELALLTVHGVLHLLGYDHELPTEEGRMRNREAEILSLLNLL